MNTKSMVAGMAIGSLLVIGHPGHPGRSAPRVARRDGSDPRGDVGGHEDCHTSMASMMWMMHQHHAMMGEGMMGDGPDGMMGDGMMGAAPTA